MLVKIPANVFIVFVLDLVFHSVLTILHLLFVLVKNKTVSRSIMAELLLAASVPRQGSLNPDDSDEEDLMDGAAGASRGVKLKRQPGKPTDVYSWFEITLQDIDVPSQTFRCSIEIHLFWQDYNLPNVIPDFEEEEIRIHDDYVPIKMSEIFENKTGT